VSGECAGALSCTLAQLLSQTAASAQLETPAQVFACDISPVAAAYTELNARRLAVDAIVAVRQGSWCEPLQHMHRCFGGVVSNPPYIPNPIYSTLQEEVRRCAAPCSAEVESAGIPAPHVSGKGFLSASHPAGRRCLRNRMAGCGFPLQARNLFCSTPCIPCSER
jgi:hypothetical protein